MVDGSRILIARSKKKLSQTKLADKMGLSQRTISAWEKGTRSIRADQAKQLSEILDISVAELLDNDTVSTKSVVKIPIYAAEASAGAGCFNDTETVENYIMIDRELLKKEFQCNPDSMAIIKVRGDSMLPTIRPGEMVVIEKTHDLVTDGLYVVRMDNGVVVVKRIQTLPGGKISVISDNSVYPAYTVNLAGGEDIAVIGRVIAILSIEKVGA
jgi:phage repressor protein C with HTH and peptisase S24 domain